MRRRGSVEGDGLLELVAPQTASCTHDGLRAHNGIDYNFMRLVHTGARPRVTSSMTCWRPDDPHISSKKGHHWLEVRSVKELPEV